MTEDIYAELETTPKGADGSRGFVSVGGCAGAE
jgi:hypothetical protein